MLGFVSRIVGQRGTRPDDADGTDDSEGSADPDGTEGRDGRPPTRLYECPDCESVYLSADLAMCESCDTPVEPVPSEEDLGYGSAEGR